MVSVVFDCFFKPMQILFFEFCLNKKLTPCQLQLVLTFMLNAYGLGEKRTDYEGDEEDNMEIFPDGSAQTRPIISTGAKEFSTTTTTNQAVKDLLKNKDIQDLLERFNKMKKSLPVVILNFQLHPFVPTG